MIDYDALYSQHGDSARALDWSEEGQKTRFMVLFGCGISVGDEVLDIGCGLGHFASFVFADTQHYTIHDGSAVSVMQNGKVKSYLGIDAHEPTVVRARERFGNYDNVRFEHRSFEQLREGEADVVVASGVVNIENGRNMEDACDLLERGFKAARRVFAVNFLSDVAEKRAEGRHYFSPEMMLSEALEIAKRVVLRHDYRDNDFTLYLWR